MPIIYIIVINYNGYKDTIECVESLKKINYKNYKIIIVDNASTNNSIMYIKQSLKDCFIIELKENLGFASGNNAGIEYAIKNGGEYVLLLNNDTIVESNFLENMIESFSDNRDIGIVGSKIMYYFNKNIIWYGGGNFNWFKFIPTHYGMRELDKGQCDEQLEMDFMTGCCMLIKKEVFEKVGLLSEEYFMYFEDADFCIKVKEAGYKIWYNPKAVIYHKVGSSGGGEESDFLIKWSTRNRILFMKKYKNKVNKLNFLFTNIFFYSTRIIRYIEYRVRGKNDKGRAIIEGIKLSSRNCL
ncbi:glycosyl transferase [Clostridium gelidum]|uniref:Glycosyl transferase n=1 Tax=Clostridium gelidum TaxID=704125 RepID=A0ABM7T557_9CLOT|nr:glycosyltransferase family 2 protein [Clostridium gelidum]BCZ47099.1 glycosyl transferase [Clostridium gelidum]